MYLTATQLKLVNTAIGLLDTYYIVQFNGKIKIKELPKAQE